jgi:hypothetical protein
MPNEEAHQRIEELKKALYSRKGPPHLRKEGELSPKEYKVASDWKEDDGPEPKPSMPGGLFKKIFIFSLFFFVIAGFIAVFLFFKGGNVVSANNVNITILGPVSVGAGEELSLDIAVANKNSVDLQLTDLVITYPSGTRQAGNTTVELPRERFTIGTVASGATIQKTIKAVLFGQQGDPKEMTIRVEYRLKDSNTVFFKEKKYQVAIESSPVSLAIDSLKEINSGQEMTMTLHITSNSASLIKGLLLRAEFPFGFKFESATPKPSSAQSVWSLGDIEAGGERTIKITGTILGQDNDERVFRFYTGTESPSDEFAIGTVFIDTKQEVVVHKPFLGVQIALDGDQNDPHISDHGLGMRGELSWTNNLATALNNTVIDMKVTGSALDKSSISASEGFYNSNNDTIEWAGDKSPSLVELVPGETGKVSFQIRSIDFSDPKNLTLKNPQINLDVTVKGQRFSDKNVPESITSTISRTIKIGASLSLEGKISYDNGPFQNTGPVPPKAEVPTTYTVVLNAKGALNDIKNAFVTSKLPSYVKWVGTVSPSSAVIAYNPVTREVRWDIGDIPAGTGYFKDPKQVSFQVSFLPSLSQVGTTPTIINDLVLSGGDTFTSKQIVVNVQPLKADLKDERIDEVDKGEVVR